ncbi:hypothetical protein Pcinc_037941 [Petrolisthes cinctipes]|uniref:Uncharacterized protein n=1 Tax=Petrolisthes cinctipes TaxID=88211 RepID=A0AAE1ENH5_PETCI|nr:hypothetical protein Pcinc_037941 [Petrolisthes cinctipes]
MSVVWGKSLSEAWLGVPRVPPAIQCLAARCYKGGAVSGRAAANQLHTTPRIKAKQGHGTTGHRLTSHLREPGQSGPGHNQPTNQPTSQPTRRGNNHTRAS